MNLNISIKNFRCFDEKGAEFQLRPLTFLTGGNSSGKSSFVKAFMVLGNYWEDLKRASKQENRIDPYKIPLNFARGGLKLGQFNSVINKNDDSSEKSIVFSYDAFSFLCRDVLHVTLQFNIREKDKMNLGWLTAFSIKDSNNAVLYKSEKGRIEYNLTPLVDEFYKYLDVCKYSKEGEAELTVYGDKMKEKMSHVPYQ